MSVKKVILLFILFFIGFSIFSCCPPSSVCSITPGDTLKLKQIGANDFIAAFPISSGPNKVHHIIYLVKDTATVVNGLPGPSPFPPHYIYDAFGITKDSTIASP